ncbi:MAG: carbohydrate binding domain-containing protein [Planctomycetia bacterium]|nr:carbohydrate binding domain-containing protein [Planctomycetia bacterium]
MKTIPIKVRRCCTASRAVLFGAFSLVLLGAAPCGAAPWSFTCGFEDGLSRPWGTGQTLNHKTAWWNSGVCTSTASKDWRVRRNGMYSLHINNTTPRAADNFGTTQLPLTFQKGHRYQAEIWALARGLASDGAVSVAVDEKWTTRPIQLPKGTYDWRRFTGEFTWPGGDGQCRLMTEDRGEVWLDDLSIVDLGVK